MRDKKKMGWYRLLGTKEVVGAERKEYGSMRKER